MQSKGAREASHRINRGLSQFRNIDESMRTNFIHKVHDHLRNISRTAYDPNIVAIGPYHHHKKSYKRMEDHKLRYLLSILKRKGESSAERYISAIEGCEQKARNCYAEPIKLSRYKFIEMLILDGCFIIELVRKFQYNSYSPGDPLFHTQWMLDSLQRDLMLFENQIPFFVLCELFDLIEGANQRRTLIDRLIKFFKSSFPGDVTYKKQKNSNCPEDDVKHLLDLIYRWWTPEKTDCHIQVNSESNSQQKEKENSESNSPKREKENSESNSQKKEKKKESSRFIHSVSKLIDANVKFKKRETFDSLFEVEFHNKTLEMPTLTIDDGTDCFFRNLIAYEQYYPNVADHTYVADYVGFLDLLINSSKDVDILSECGIIDSWLGDNEVIAKMINRLNDSVDGPAEHVYCRTFEDINTFYKKPWNRWMAVLKRDYFSSPWASISVTAAFFLLVFTIIQTVCSILQVV